MSITGKNVGQQFESFAELHSQLSKYFLNLHNIAQDQNCTKSLPFFSLVLQQCKKKAKLRKTIMIEQCALEVQNCLILTLDWCN